MKVDSPVTHSLMLSVVVLAWDQLPFTRRCIESIRRNTDVSYELVVVDNGSGHEAASYAKASADRVVLNSNNQGFAAGMNQGLAVSQGTFVAFVNNDTELPPEWASRLVESLTGYPDAAIVAPAVTSAMNPRTVRRDPGRTVEILRPFELPPSGVVYVMPSVTARRLGGWSEDLGIASGEDFDLCLKVWTNEKDVLFDSRVLVVHEGKATSAVKLDDWAQQWESGNTRLTEKWLHGPPVPRLPSCPTDRYDRNRDIAASMMELLAMYRRAQHSPVKRFVKQLVGGLARRALRWRLENCPAGRTGRGTQLFRRLSS